MAQSAPIQLPLPPSPSPYHPAPELVEIRDRQPVALVSMPDGRPAWLVTGYPEVRQVLVDPRFSRAAANAPDAPRTALSMAVSGTILGMDPPEHTRLRTLVARAFTARRVEQLRPYVVELVDERLTATAAEPRPVDLVTHFSMPLPVRVICGLLGVSTEDQHLFRAWSDAALMDAEVAPERVLGALAALGGYFTEQIAAKRAQPGDDLVSALIEARDVQDRLSEGELVTLCFTLLLAGHESTANQLNWCLLTLLRHPDQFARLDDPAALPAAVEELMRFVQQGDAGPGLPRIATEDLELGGVPIAAGEAVLPVMGIASRDPAVFEHPDELDLSRTGSGSRCGTPASRREAVQRSHHGTSSPVPVTGPPRSGPPWSRRMPCWMRPSPARWRRSRASAGTCPACGWRCPNRSCGSRTG